MRIHDLLIESDNHLNEGPKWNKFGQAVGNVAGMAAKGVGAVAGGIAGLGAAAKKGFQAGKSQVAAADDGPASKTKKSAAPAKAAAPKTGAATSAAPATGEPDELGRVEPKLAGGKAATSGTPSKGKGFVSGVKAGLSKGISALNDPSSTPGSAGSDEEPAATAAGGGAGKQPAAKDINAAGPKGTAPAKPVTGQAKTAADKTAAATKGQDAAGAGQTMYAQVKANIDKLDKKGKQRIMQLLQKSLAQPAPSAMGQMAGQVTQKPNTMANAPVSKTNTAKPGNPNAAAPTGNYDGKTGAPLSDKAKADAAFDASPEGKALQAKVDAMGSGKSASTGKKPVRVQGKKAGQPAPQQQVASKINTGNMIAEGFSLFRKK